ncbi:amidohydrolase [Microbacterium oxydans]|uniref:N-substituted formamide deformylase n=1 Tax=Microbacterium oxydans TaxID=82380 RepID=A0A0F0LEN6_9MICO|nr:amidohydrolase [Microbacterium oxydans]KJL30006.1 N-substituted formamide deformylase precursor [Microbacterium oxydans]
MTTVFTGRIRPLAPAIDTDAEAMAVDGGRVVAVGTASSLAARFPDAETIALDGWVMPGLIEPHGHPAFSAIVLSDLVVDVRPVGVPDADGVLARVRSAVADADGAVFVNGWDGLLQRGLPDPDMRFLDGLAGEVPLVVIHNSGHSAYFNSAAALAAGVDDSTPDPVGASFGRDADGSLTGVALEAAAVELIVAPLLAAAQQRMPQLLLDHLRDLASRGITTVSDLSWNTGLDPLIAALREQGVLPVRLRWYEMSRPGGIAAPPADDDPVFRQTGVKTWSDGSPWIGNIATSFPYLDTPATRALGLEPHHRGSANYTAAELLEIAEPYAAGGWQLACHAHGDLAIDATLDVYEQIIARHGLADHRFRLEHCGAMTAPQFERAATLGVTVSLFVDHITYWGEVLVDDLFGAERGGAWADAGAAFAAGHRATFHNDGWVTPNEPFRNMAVAETRTTRAGYRMPGGTPVTREQALAAHTVNAAWQLFSEHEVGALAPGLFADFLVVDRDPLSVSAEELASTVVRATYLSGARVV